MLTARKFAQRAGITYPTVMAWLRKGLIPGAKLTEDSPLGSFWQIPAESLNKVQKQKTGPKPKASNAGGDALNAGSQSEMSAEESSDSQAEKPVRRRKAAKK